MRYQAIATFEDAYNCYLAQEENYYSKVYLKDTNCRPLKTFNYLQSIDVNDINNRYEVVHYSWIDDTIIFMLQPKEV